MLQVKSTIDLPKMRELFFAGDTFRLSGQESVHRHVSSVQRAAARRQDAHGARAQGHVRQHDGRRERLPVRRSSRAGPLDAGGAARSVKRRRRCMAATRDSRYLMAPLNAPGVTPTATLRRGVGQRRSDRVHRLARRWTASGWRVACPGRTCSSGRLRRFSARTGKGELHITPPDGVTLMTREMPLERIRAVEKRGQPAGPFSPLTPFEPVPIGGDLVYAFDPDAGRVSPEPTGNGVDARRVRGADGVRRGVADPVSRVERGLAGERSRVCRTAHGVRRPHARDSDRRVRHLRRRHVRDVQAPANRRRLRGLSRCARGMSSGDRSKGRAVIQNSYVDVSDVVITSGESRIRTDRTLLDRVSAQRRRRRDRRAGRDH